MTHTARSLVTGETLSESTENRAIENGGQEILDSSGQPPRRRRSPLKKKTDITTVSAPQSIAGVRRYDWANTAQVGQRAMSAVRNFLESDAARNMWTNVRSVFDVSNNSFHQKRDTDLLLVVKDASGMVRTSIEVKGDRNDHTGNLFLETVSDVERSKKGAFLVTEAEWFFYYFINSGHLFCLRMQDAAPWFASKEKFFRERETSSFRGSRTWKTKGKLVPISLVMSDLPSTWHFVYRGAWRKLD